MNVAYLYGLIVVLLIAIILLGVKLIKFHRRYSGLIDVDGELERVQSEIERENASLKASQRDHSRRMKKLNEDYNGAKSIYDKLRAQVGLLEESLEDMSFGIYRPFFDFETPEQYKQALEKVYAEKKRLIKDGQAYSCPNNWSVNGSTREGAKMVKQEAKLMLKAFNGEVDASVAKVRWNNVTKMEERITRTFQAINELGSVMQIQINGKYLKQCRDELHLMYELDQKKQEIKEEQRQIREQIREEEQAQREFEKARKQAEAEEARYRRALEVARAEMEKAKDAEMGAIAEKVRLLQLNLVDAQSKLQRAVSMAEITKSGHVYVISNIGSFGEDVFKIGMSRRLEPSERVYELGSASVPFPYDIHAMIFSNDAPSLENAFHKQFHSRRVNLVNMRKEFFRVSLDEIESFALSHDAQIEFSKLAEAREYRETVSLLERALEYSENTTKEEEFPSTLDAVEAY